MYSSGMKSRLHLRAPRFVLTFFIDEVLGGRDASSAKSKRVRELIDGSGSVIMSRTHYMMATLHRILLMEALSFIGALISTSLIDWRK